MDNYIIKNLVGFQKRTTTKMFFYKETDQKTSLFPKTLSKLKEISRSEEEAASADTVLPGIREQIVGGKCKVSFIKCNAQLRFLRIGKSFALFYNRKTPVLSRTGSFRMSAQRSGNSQICGINNKVGAWVRRCRDNGLKGGLSTVLDCN